jgi:hypothetical protein
MRALRDCVRLDAAAHGPATFSVTPSGGWAWIHEAIVLEEGVECQKPVCGADLVYEIGDAAPAISLAFAKVERHAAP